MTILMTTTTTTMMMMMMTPLPLQAIATRTAGFQCIDISLWAPSVQVLTVFMMYLAVYPQVSDDDDDDDDDGDDDDGDADGDDDDAGEVKKWVLLLSWQAGSLC
jgi:hypothetical protein